ncbi:MAG TPA: prepilin-type N-terminal cleavage/methylation domain-containing protein [Gemmatimonadales bacterium]|jgi:prepilin-type N-terminal cleavage/methylation domain-containing protein|nr:prepilin-type N-terminal cleavage/methylation domain-containing protein [Gemmatimonadales bacterium]
MSAAPRSPAAARGGYSLVEMLLAIVVLSMGLLALAAGSAISARDMNRSRRDTQYWGDVQQVADSLLLTGWGAVTAGSTTVRGRAMSWTVTTVNANTKRLNILVTRYRYSSLTASVQDTVGLTLSNPMP